MSETDRLLANNDAHVAGVTAARDSATAGTPAPSPLVAVVACMDARLDPARALGLEAGDAHVIRNAGGVVTDDTIRSLTISQHLMGTEEIVLVHHTDCAMTTFSDREVADRIEAETGRQLPFALGAFADIDDDVRESIARIKASPFIPRTGAVRGFVYELDSGRLREVT